MSNKTTLIFDFSILGFLGMLILLVASAGAFALGQETQSATSSSPASVVPHLIRFSGTLPGAPGKAETVDVKFALYDAQTGGDALWSETQQVSLDSSGKYSVLIGSVTVLPDSVFAQGQARWIGVTLGGEPESARTVLVATPYSLKASDAETLGGHPVSDFALRNALPATGTDITQINVGNGITGGGTGPTVTLGLSSTYLENLGNEIYPQLGGTNTLTGKNTYAAGKLFIGSSPVLSAANVLASSPLSVSASGDNVTIGLNDSALLTLGNSVYAQLGAANTFTAGQTFKSSVTFASGQTFPGTVALGGNNTFSGTNSFSKAITFASGQTFPGTGAGTITGITTSSPLSGSGTSGSVALSLNTSSLESTLDGIYPQLSGANTFSGSNAFSNAITFASGQIFPGVPTLSGADTFTGLVSMSDSTAPGAVLTVTNSETTGDAYAVSGSVPSGLGSALVGNGGYGVYGQTNAAAAFGSSPIGVLGTVPSGYTNNTGYEPIGVWGLNQVFGIGVYGESVDGPGIEGVTNKGNAVYGLSSSGNGVLGATSDTVSAGVEGLLENSSSTGYGVLGETRASSGFGVHALAGAASADGGFIPGLYGAALWADTNQTYAEPGSLGALVGTADDNYAASFFNESDNEPTLYLENDGSGGTSNVVHMLVATSPRGSCGISGTGDVTCSGRLKTAVPVAGGSEQVEVYSVQSSENWFEDFGSGQLFNGSAKVLIDPRFGKIVNTGVAYHVFLTPKGNCKGLFVTNEGANGFEVRELGDGGSSVEFDYRIVAKRTGHESERLVDATAEMRQMTQRGEEFIAKRAAGHAAIKHVLPREMERRIRPMTMPGAGRGAIPAAHQQAAAAQEKK